jgi:hypothetical protein
LLSESKYNNPKNFGGKIFTVFVSTHVCDKAFSLMKMNKSDIRVCMTYEYLSVVFYIAKSTITMNIGKLVSNCK